MVKQNVQAILNGLSLAVFIVNRKRVIKFANAAAGLRFGKDLIDKDFSEILNDEGVLNAIDKVFLGAERATTEITMPSVVPTLFHVSVTRLDEDDGTFLRASVSFEDISHVREAVQMRTDFVANVSHELRSPLTSVYGIIETLKGPARGDLEAHDRFLDMMETEAQRMTRLINDLLSLSKFQALKRETPSDRIDVQQVLESVNASLAVIRENEGVDVAIETTLLNTYIVGDADELHQVFKNLIENAVKYSPRGSRVTVETVKPANEQGFLQVSVTDQGEGIAPEHIPRLTERFYRVDKGRSRAKGGTGLGLAIVKHIMIRHNGRLEITSKLGEGSVFSVFLPTLARRK